MTCFTSPLKNVTITDTPSALISLRVPLENVTTREPSGLITSRYENIDVYEKGIYDVRLTAVSLPGIY